MADDTEEEALLRVLDKGVSREVIATCKNTPLLTVAEGETGSSSVTDAAKARLANVLTNKVPMRTEVRTAEKRGVMLSMADTVGNAARKNNSGTRCSQRIVNYPWLHTYLLLLIDHGPSWPADDAAKW